VSSTDFLGREEPPPSPDRSPGEILASSRSWSSC